MTNLKKIQYIIIIIIVSQKYKIMIIVRIYSTCMTGIEDKAIMVTTWPSNHQIMYFHQWTTN